MISAGLKEKYHNQIIHRLTDEVCFYVYIQALACGNVVVILNHY